MTAVPDIVDLQPPNHDSPDGVAPDLLPAVPVEDSGKRKLDELDERDESEPKKCKTDVDADNVETAPLSKRQIKKMHKHQMWLEKKALRK